MQLPTRCIYGLAVIVALLVASVATSAERMILSPTDAACKTIVINAKGTGNATITVDATAGGITVLDALATRCGALIQNEAGSGDMRCTTGALAPTTTVGILVQAGQSLSLDLEAQQVMKCIRTGATSATVSTVEKRG